MLNFYNNLPASTKLLIQSFLAVLGSVLSGVAVAVYQSYIMSSQINLAVLWNVALVTFALLFGKAMHDWVPAHAQQIIQAGKENEGRLYDALQRAQQIRSAQNVPAVQPPSHVVVPVPANLKSEDVSAIAAQLAVNLINLAAERASQQTEAQKAPQELKAPVTPVPQVAYTPSAAEPVRHWGDTGVVPAIADQAAQVPFTV